MSNNGFNPRLLLIARQYRQLSQGSVALRAGINQGHYSRIENGLVVDGPSKESIERIAGALEFPADFFYQDDGLAGLPLSVHPMHRKKASIGDRELKKIHAALNIRLMHLRKLLRAVDLQPELPRPQIDVDEGGGAARVARIVRASWSVPEGPIGNLMDLCERAGLIVIVCDLDAFVDGVTLSVRDLPPCIFLNGNVPADRMRHSLAHELGHVVMHRVPTECMEREANTFASELLVPEQEFRRALIGHKLSLDWLARQKMYWRVSMASLLFKAGSLGLTTRHQQEYMWKKFSALGWRSHEPDETTFEPETPTVFPELLRLHAEDFGYGLSEFQSLFCVSVSDVLDLYRGYLGRRRLYAVN